MMVTAPTEPGVREIAADLAQARDAQITRVVAMLDEMPDRGAADALIAPLRARLAQLRPARPLSFVRLLFSPFDPVIVPPGQWAGDHVGLPRAALAPIGQAIRTAMPALGTALEDSAGRVAIDDRAAIARLGAELWPSAASLLERMACPPGWAEAPGLGMEDFAPLVAVMVGVLRQASAIEGLAAARAEPEDDAIRAILSGAAPHGPKARATMVAILAARLPFPDRVLVVASQGAALPAAESAMAQALARIQAMTDDPVDPRSAMEAAVDAARVAALLAGLEDGAAPNRERRAQIESIRKGADALCRRRFDCAITATRTLAEAARKTECDDATLAGLEHSARDLRRLEAAGRRLGSGAHYDALIGEVAGQFRGPDGALGLAERVRLVEILRGPDEALALLLGSPA